MAKLVHVTAPEDLLDLVLDVCDSWNFRKTDSTECCYLLDLGDLSTLAVNCHDNIRLTHWCIVSTSS